VHRVLFFRLCVSCYGRRDPAILAAVETCRLFRAHSLVVLARMGRALCLQLRLGSYDLGPSRERVNANCANRRRADLARCHRRDLLRTQLVCLLYPPGLNLRIAHGLPCCRVSRGLC